MLDFAFKTFKYTILFLISFSLISCDSIKKWINSLTQNEDSSSIISEEKPPMAVNEQMDFLNKNKTKEGVQTTSSGLQYKILKEGSGKSPSAQSQVEVHYKGTLINGFEFDSSYKRNQTAQFPLNQVIPGWTEGLQLMKEGATYEFYIPSHLAYKNRDLPSIPAGSTLIFKVELIKVL